MASILSRPQCVNEFKLQTRLPLTNEISTGAIINSLWPSDAMWRQRSGSTLAQVMACCLSAPNHYLNQCWLIIIKVQWHSSEPNFTRDTSATNHWNKLENYLSKISFKSPRGQWVNLIGMVLALISQHTSCAQTGSIVYPSTLYVMFVLFCFFFSLESYTCVLAFIIIYQCWDTSDPSSQNTRTGSFYTVNIKAAPPPWHIEAETKWPTFSRWHFQIPFLERKCMNFD